MKPLVETAPWEARFSTLETSFREHQKQVDDDIKSLAGEFRKSASDLRHDFGIAFDRINSKMDTQFSTMQSKQEERTKTNWTPILTGAGIIVAVMTTLGNMSLGPIRENVAELKANASDYLTRQETEPQRQRNAEERQFVRDELKGLKDGLVSRAEHQERWRSIDNQFGDMQRQIDNISKAQGDTYTARDAILDLKKRVDDLQDRLQLKP